MGNRNGFFYVLDRATGQFLLGKPFTKVTWRTGSTTKADPSALQSPTEEGPVIFPHVVGGTNWMSPSFSPRTGLFYIPSLMDSYATFPRRAVEFVEGRVFVGAFPVGPIQPLWRSSPSQPSNPRRELPAPFRRSIRRPAPRNGSSNWPISPTVAC